MTVGRGDICRLCVSVACKHRHLIAFFDDEFPFERHSTRSSALILLHRQHCLFSFWSFFDFSHPVGDARLIGRLLPTWPPALDCRPVFCRANSLPPAVELILVELIKNSIRHTTVCVCFELSPNIQPTRSVIAQWNRMYRHTISTSVQPNEHFTKCFRLGQNDVTTIATVDLCMFAMLKLKLTTGATRYHIHHRQTWCKR